MNKKFFRAYSYIEYISFPSMEKFHILQWHTFFCNNMEEATALAQTLKIPPYKSVIRKIVELESVRWISYRHVIHNNKTILKEYDNELLDYDVLKINPLRVMYKGFVNFEKNI